MLLISQDLGRVIKDTKQEILTTENMEFKGKIDDYTFGKELGKGAYSVVKRATHKPTSKKVAIKIYEKYRILDPLRKEAIKREIQILRKLDHPNVIKLFEVIDHPKQVKNDTNINTNTKYLLRY